MKIVMNDEGLGNQMFFNAFMCELHSRTGEPCFLMSNRKNTVHGGIKVYEAFPNVDVCKAHGIKRHFFFLLETLFSSGRFPTIKFMRLFMREVRYKPFFIFNEQLAFGHGRKNIFFYGQFQGEDYFSHVAEQIRNDFQFNVSQLNEFTHSMAEQILEYGRKSAFIHVRRGDYIKPEFQMLAQTALPDYYEKAISYIGNHEPDVHYFVFSDDIAFCREQFVGDNFTFVDGKNFGKDCWQDMYLMSLCHHAVIPSSTFSWWGAWLGTTEDRIIVAPKQWTKQLKKTMWCGMLVSMNAKRSVGQSGCLRLTAKTSISFMSLLSATCNEAAESL